ncbi:hypothetical protein FSST1_009808 [Fusarium sambucinum]
MPSFQYVPLAIGESETDQQEFRFLELHPGSSDAPLVGTMLHRVINPFTEENIFDFEALSYCWGSQAHPESITLTNELRANEEEVVESEAGHINIGTNLASALRALRHPSDKRILWCDSVCINQKDLSERSTQVDNMHWIYRTARSVIIWLSAETTWSIMAMETVRWAASQLLSVDSNSEAISFEFKPGADERLIKDKHIPLSLSQWQAVEQLLDLNWNKRLWTFQEARLAKQESCIVKLGGEEIPWMKLRDAICLIAGLKTPPSNAIQHPACWNTNLENFAWKALSPDTDRDRDYNDWVASISEAASFQCSDSRDRVYAVRGLIAPTTSKHVKTDYTKSTKEVFELVCLNHIVQKGNLDFLNMCNGASCPSWVADLEMPLNRLYIDSNAAGASLCSAYMVEPGVLEVAGMLCDELGHDPILIDCDGGWKHAVRIRSIVNVFQALSNTDLHNDDECLDKLIMMLTYGDVRDYSTVRFERPRDRGRHFLKDWRWRIRQWLSGIFVDEHDNENPREADASYLDSTDSGTLTGCSRTCSGSFVRVPMASQSGDKVACFLGSRSLIILRPQSNPNTYQVIGPGYHPGFSKEEAFLGSDFYGWQPLWASKRNYLVFYKDGQPLRYADPRLEGVPLEGDYQEAYTESSDKEEGWQYWTHPSTEEITLNNPRLSEAALKKRGVPITRFHLV